MRVLIVAPGAGPCAAELEDSLAAMQAVVGGLIQAVYPFEEPIALVCNEEGKLLGLPSNRVLRMPETGEIYDVVCGTFFLCAASTEGEIFESLSEEQIARYTELFRIPDFAPEDAP